jgi:hypothetical protein
VAQYLQQQQRQLAGVGRTSPARKS